MAFVNEYVSEEDIKKFDLDDLWHRWHRVWDGKFPPGHRHTWTVDRERGAYFKPMRVGREEHSNRYEGVLFWNGIEWQVDIDLADNSSASFNDVPFKRVWDLVRIQHPEGKSVPRDEIILILKEALIAFGYQGISRQIPNTVVTFNF